MLQILYQLLRESSDENSQKKLPMSSSRIALKVVEVRED